MFYNPELKSHFMFVPGVITLILILICALMTSVTITREKEFGTMEVLLVSPLPSGSDNTWKGDAIFPTFIHKCTADPALSWLVFGLAGKRKYYPASCRKHALHINESDTGNTYFNSFFKHAAGYFYFTHRIDAAHNSAFRIYFSYRKHAEGI